MKKMLETILSIPNKVGNGFRKGTKSATNGLSVGVKALVTIIIALVIFSIYLFLNVTTLTGLISNFGEGVEAESQATMLIILIVLIVGGFSSLFHKKE